MSNNTFRILTGLVGIPLILLFIISGGLFFFVFALIVNVLCLWEYHRLFESKGFKISGSVAIVLSVAILILNLWALDYAVYAFLFSILLLAVIGVIRTDRNPINLFISVAGIIYITVPLALMMLMRDMYSFNPVLLMIILIWVCDSGAYFIGLKFGKHRLSSISPRKTWEGSIGGFIFAIIAAFVYGSFYSSEMNISDMIAFGVIAGTLGQAGDLFESMLKRYCGVKDSSKIIPGHGGFLDRFDSFLFISIPVYLYLVLLKPLF